MLRIVVRFPAGRYHATPWGMHVNEDAIEWPPSPWRVLRALFSAGFTRLGWTALPDEARALFARLCDALPAVHLPPATAAHTRHYMPLFKGNTTRKLDTFACVQRGALGLEYDVELSDEELALLDELLAAVPYLGRAESWVELERVEQLPDGLALCVASEAMPGPKTERVVLLAPEASETYAAWRRAAVERETKAQAEAARRKAAEKGKSFKALAKKDLEKVEGLFPVDVVTALLADTPALQRQGWSQPPGTRWIAYWRPEGALRTAPQGARPRAPHERADTALLALSSDTRHAEALPAMRDAVLRLDALHDTLVKASAKREGAPSPCFVGNIDGDRLWGHRHATLVPLCLDGRKGRMDHVLVHAPMGFDEAARIALSAVHRTYAKGLPDLFVTLAGMGERSAFDELVHELGEARVWRSSMPFVPPRYLKPRGKNTLVGQVQEELASRGLPSADSVEIQLDDESFAPGPSYWEAAAASRLSARFRHVRLARPDRPPPMLRGLSLRLTFAEPVRGPVALGYGSHFGLGVMAPERGG